MRRRKKLYEEEEFINTATNTAAGTMRRKQYTIVYHGPRDDYEARMGDDYIPNTERLGLSGPWRWVRTEAYSTDTIERLAVVPDSVHAWQWDCYDKEEEQKEEKKEEAQKEEAQEAQGGGASSSGYSPEYKNAGPAAQRVLQAGMMFKKAAEQ